MVEDEDESTRESGRGQLHMFGAVEIISTESAQEMQKEKRHGSSRISTDLMGPGLGPGPLWFSYRPAKAGS